MAFYPNDTTLIISIDNDGKNKYVFELAEKFDWKFGQKKVIYHNEHLGLKRHILNCGKYCYEYGSIIMLEDDLVVSPFFYEFAAEALKYYQVENKIAGISLYNLPYTEASKIPFIPLQDDSDVYFMQIPSSLGQAWSVEQWDEFSKWYLKEPDLKKINGLPVITTKYWSASSWKKYFYGFLVESGKYFVYPQLSLTSNFNDRGENMWAKTFVGQVSLQITPRNYKFKSLDLSINVYDAYSEISSDVIKRFCKDIENYDLEMDLFGQKESFSKDYVITSKHCRKKLSGYERALKPHELNIFYNLKGNDFSLARREDVIYDDKTIDDIIFKTKPIEEYIADYTYYHNNVMDSKKMIPIILYRFKNKLFRSFRKKTQH